MDLSTLGPPQRKPLRTVFYYLLHPAGKSRHRDRVVEYFLQGLIALNFLAFFWGTIPYIKLHYGDLLDPASIQRIIAEVGPDEIYHLGAQSHVRVSFEVPVSTVEITVLGTLHLLEAIRAHGNEGHEIRFYNAASSEMCGNAPETPQTEERPFNPSSPYGCAKVYAYYQTRN